MRLKWKLVSVLSNIVLILMQDRCTFCAECTIGTEIVVDAPEVTWVMWNLTCFHSETLLALVQDRCMVCAGHTIG